jgi:predicted phage tail protein
MATQAQQIAQIGNDVTSLRKEHGEAIAAMRIQVSKIEERMKTYESKQEEQIVLSKQTQVDVKQIQHTIGGYDATLGAILRIARYTLYSIFTLSGGVAVIVVANWILALLHIHP